jgi:hypothetical protein
MSGNPYDADATALLREAEQAYGPEHADAYTKAAAVKATLALAYEQRTANLIALYSMDDGARQGMVDGAGVHSGNWVDVTKQIKERLGLA